MNPSSDRNSPGNRSGNSPGGDSQQNYGKRLAALPPGARELAMARMPNDPGARGSVYVNMR